MILKQIVSHQHYSSNATSHYVYLELTSLEKMTYTTLPKTKSQYQINNNNNNTNIETDKKQPQKLNSTVGSKM